MLFAIEDKRSIARPYDDGGGRHQLAWAAASMTILPLKPPIRRKDPHPGAVRSNPMKPPPGVLCDVGIHPEEHCIRLYQPDDWPQFNGTPFTGNLRLDLRNRGPLLSGTAIRNTRHEGQ